LVCRHRSACQIHQETRKGAMDSLNARFRSEECGVDQKNSQDVTYSASIGTSTVNAKCANRLLWKRRDLGPQTEKRGNLALNVKIRSEFVSVPDLRQKPKDLCGWVRTSRPVSGFGLPIPDDPARQRLRDY
jgi:hypothetical protein